MLHTSMSVGLVFSTTGRVLELPRRKEGGGREGEGGRRVGGGRREEGEGGKREEGGGREGGRKGLCLRKLI